METVEKKCVMVLDGGLPMGLLTNTAAVLGTTLGQRFPELVGDDVPDASGQLHRGLIKIPVPILRAEAEWLGALRARLYREAPAGLEVIDVSQVAQRCKNYGDYTGQLGATPGEALGYLGIILYGEKQAVNKLTGSLPLLR